MKKVGVLNSNISRVIADMGHKDLLAIGDAGLPVPANVEKIDLAVAYQNPTFQSVLESVLLEQEVERIFLAEEIKEFNPSQLAQIKAVLPEVEISWLSHEAFKAKTTEAKAVIRTGESHPYANIILQSGVAF